LKGRMRVECLGYEKEAFLILLKYILEEGKKWGELFLMVNGEDFCLVGRI
jgi:hypothetical protein